MNSSFLNALSTALGTWGRSTQRAFTIHLPDSSHPTPLPPLSRFLYSIPIPINLSPRFLLRSTDPLLGRPPLVHHTGITVMHPTLRLDRLYQGPHKYHIPNPKRCQIVALQCPLYRVDHQSLHRGGVSSVLGELTTKTGFRIRPWSRISTPFLFLFVIEAGFPTCRRVLLPRVP